MINMILCIYIYIIDSYTLYMYANHREPNRGFKFIWFCTRLVGPVHSLASTASMAPGKSPKTFGNSWFIRFFMGEIIYVNIVQF